MHIITQEKENWYVIIYSTCVFRILLYFFLLCYVHIFVPARSAFLLCLSAFPSVGVVIQQ